MATKEADETIIDADEELEKKDLEKTASPKEDEVSTEKEPNGDEADETNEDGEVIVSIDGVSPDTEEDAANSPLIKDLRQRIKDTNRRNRELEDELKKVVPANKAAEVGTKPTLESCEYDGDKFEAELLAWNKRKSEVDDANRAKAKENEALELSYKQRQQDYETAKGNLKVKDFTDAEEAVKTNFSLMQQAIIIKGAKDSAVIVYALGKNPDKAKELAAIKDPVDFAFAVARLEGKLTVTTKKAPLPEKKPNSSGGTSNSGATDKKLAALRAKAEETGNYTEVVAYKKQLKK